MNITPDEYGDRIDLRQGTHRTADGSEYYVIRTEVNVHRDSIPEDAIPSYIGRMVELAHPFVLNDQRETYAISSERLERYTMELEEAGIEYEVIEDCAPFKVPSQIAIGQVVLLTEGGTLPSPSLEMEGEG